MKKKTLAISNINPIYQKQTEKKVDKLAICLMREALKNIE